MAELFAFGRKAEHLTLEATLVGSGVTIKLREGALHPELRLSASDWATVKRLAEPPKPEPAAPTTWRGYTAANPMPAGAVPYQGAPFNIPIPANPTVLSNSAAMVAWCLEGRNHIENLTTSTGFTTVYFASTKDELVTINGSGGKGLRTGEDLAGRMIRCPSYAVAQGGRIEEGSSDAHITLVQPSGECYDLWQARIHPSLGYIEASGAGLTNVEAGSGVCTVGGAVAACTGSLAGLIRAPELVAGNIPHAVVVACHKTRPGFVAPATNSDGTEPAVNAPFEGQLFVLDMTVEEIEALNAPRHAKTIAKAAAQYGVYVVDSGGEGFGFHLESGFSYSSAGAVNPLEWYARERFAAKEAGVEPTAYYGQPEYVLTDMGSIPWETHLKAIEYPW